MSNNSAEKISEMWLDGHFLIAMPGMSDTRFDKTVIYVCAHSEEGAMGLVINRPQEMALRDLLVQLDIVDANTPETMKASARDMIVRDGGPVERSRGFVLHTSDYCAESSMPVASEICLTATIDILRDISRGEGPDQALMALGYAGWAPGQLENEISENGWLTCPASHTLVFEQDVENLYEQVLGSIGIDPLFLSLEAGRA